MNGLSLDPVEGVLLVLDEGSATGTNKFGLLLALIDLAPSVGADGVLTGDVLVEKLIDIHWEHTRPFAGGGPLRQVTSSNRSSTLIGQIQQLQTAASPNLSFEQARHEIPDEIWNAAAANVLRDLRRNPLPRLQKLAGDPPPFLYEIAQSQPLTIRFLPGVAETLIRFGPVLRAMVEFRFIRILVKANAHELGASTEAKLEEHLFGVERRMPPLGMRREMWELQGRCCVFTGQPIDDPTRRQRAVAVDHVIPWSRYRLSEAENFVLTATSTNSTKRDFLLAPSVLQRWIAYLTNNSNDLAATASRHGWPTDLDRVLAVTESVYRTASSATPAWTETGPHCLGAAGKSLALQTLTQLL